MGLGWGSANAYPWQFPCSPGAGLGWPREIYLLGLLTWRLMQALGVPAAGDPTSLQLLLSLLCPLPNLHTSGTFQKFRSPRSQLSAVS